MAEDQQPDYDTRSAVPVEEKGDHPDHGRPDSRQEKPMRPGEPGFGACTLDAGGQESKAQEVEYFGGCKAHSDALGAVGLAAHAIARDPGGPICSPFF